MKRKSKFFFNNSYEWLGRWYGIAVDSDIYRGWDFVESNDRVFYKVRLSSLLGSKKQGLDQIRNSADIDDKLKAAGDNDWVIGLVKPMSDKATIIDVLSSKMQEKDDAVRMPEIGVYPEGITWIDDFSSDESELHVNVAFASTKYMDDYKITYREISFAEKDIVNMRPLLVLPGAESGENVLKGLNFIVLTDRTSKKSNYLYSFEEFGAVKLLCGFDTLFGYNDSTIFIEMDGHVQLVKRDTGIVSDLDKTLFEAMKQSVYPEAGSSFNVSDHLAFVDAARNEFVFYEDIDARFPGKCSLVGLAFEESNGGLSITNERILFPDVLPSKENPLVYDGYKYIWRINSLWNGYMVFRKDGSLREKFIVSEGKELSKSPVVFSSPTCIFVEWDSADNELGRRLSYSTNKGLCQMFALDDGKPLLKVFTPKEEDEEFL